MASVFTKLMRGELPSYPVYEDEYVFAFLSLEQHRPGHTLVVPRVEVDYFLDVPEPYYSAVFRAAKKLGRAIHAVTGCQRVGTVIAGWDVPHFHYHLIPMFDYHDLDPRRGRQLSHEENLDLQSRIVAALENART